jgi:hypothetical protein
VRAHTHTQKYIHKNLKVKKGKVRSIAGHKGLEEEYSCSSALTLTSALDGGGWLTPRPRCFTPGKEARYPLCSRLGWPQDLYQLRTNSGRDTFNFKVSVVFYGNM